MLRLIIFLSLVLSMNAQGNMKISYAYPNNKKEKLIKIYKDKEKYFVTVLENKKETNQLISEVLYKQINKDFLLLLNKKKEAEFSCPKSIKFTIEAEDQKITYCKSSKLKKVVAKFFNRLSGIVKN